MYLVLVHIWVGVLLTLLAQAIWKRGNWGLLAVCLCIPTALEVVMFFRAMKGST